MTPRNADEATVAGFGDEWTTFDQSRLDASEADALFAQYFAVFPWDRLPRDAEGFDLGCGSGRWARQVAQRVGTLHCVDASQAALAVARRNLEGRLNCVFHHASVGDLELPSESMDFGYSLGVLHHVPDTQAALRSCARLLKPGAPLLVYLYYALDNRPAWYRAVWRASDTIRRVLSRSPHPVKLALSAAIAAFVYLPLAHASKLGARLGLAHVPLSYYADRSFYTMRTDAYDRFGTRLERRFTRTEIADMLSGAGLQDVRFSESEPYWCAVGFRAPGSGASGAAPG